MQIDFIHEDGQHDISRELKNVLSQGTAGIQIAVAFLRHAAVEMLKAHINNISQPESFIVISVAHPTDLDAVDRLNQAFPGHVYIHLGGKTPEEVGVGRALMHSKVILAKGSLDCHLWVGSQNFTATAIRGGNFEAAIKLKIARDEEKGQDTLKAAEKHLQMCKNSAELFDQKKLAYYRALQSEQVYQQQLRVHFGEKENILVIRCEAKEQPRGHSFVFELRTSTEVQGELVRPGQAVHLYVFDIGTLSTFRQSRGTRPRLYIGEVTGVNHTEYNKTHPGRQTSTNVNGFIDVVSIPELRATASPTFMTKTQIIISLKRRADGFNEFVYSMNPYPPLTAPEIIPDNQKMKMIETVIPLADFASFTKESIINSHLVYRPVKAIKRDLRIENPLPLTDEELSIIHQNIQSENRLAGYSINLTPSVTKSNILPVMSNAPTDLLARNSESETTSHIFISRYHLQSLEHGETSSLNDFE